MTWTILVFDVSSVFEFKLSSMANKDAVVYLPSGYAFHDILILRLMIAFEAERLKLLFLVVTGLRILQDSQTDRLTTTGDFVVYHYSSESELGQKMCRYAWALEPVIWGRGKSQGDKTSAFTYRVLLHSQVLSGRFHRSVPLYPFIEEVPSTDTDTHTGEFQRETRLYLIAGAKSLHRAVTNAPLTGKGGRPWLGNVLPLRLRIAFWTARKRRLYEQL
ncbi:hypothetical protein EDB83DRAFT_2442751 [Lactarius deliciosus]|nr:hypothetical protein EDB83DRAFT_2442751 [Lactarius deliciosus]